MKIFTVSNIQDFDVYPNAIEAHIDSGKADIKLKNDLSFDINKFKGKRLTEAFFSFDCIRLNFESDISMLIHLNNKGQLCMEETQGIIAPFLPYTLQVKLKYSNEIDFWSPKSIIKNFVGKVFKDIYLNRNWFFLYFSNMDVILSIRVLCVEEPPFRILYCYDTI